MQAVPFFDSRYIATQPDLLRARIAEDGYLFLPRQVPPAAVAEVFDAILRICCEHRWADASGRSTGGPRLEGLPGWFDVYDPLQCLEVFHALPHRGELVSVVAAIVEQPVLVHPRNIARITFPDTDQYSTPPHQDFVHIQGSHETYTVWMPLSDCPVELGGLAILAGSHRQEVLPVHSALGPGGVAVRTEQLDLPWHTQDLRAGDVLLFHSHTIHRALPNRSDRRLRISLDARYQGESAPVVADSLQPHYERLTWEQVYAGWQRKDLQYYWKRQPLRVVPRQPVPQEAPDAIAA